MTRTAARASLYLYALVDRRPRKPLGKGMFRHPLQVVRVGRAYVVYEEGDAVAPTPARVVAHDRVIQKIARAAAAVLPLRFASTAPDDGAMRALLVPLSDPVERALDRVRDAVQFTLRVRGARARRPDRSAKPGAVGPGTRWLAERKARLSVPEIQPLTDATRPYVRATRAERHDEDPRPRAAGGPRLLASVYHLVARADVDAWRSAVARSVPALGRVAVTTTGPWPPYAFAELT